MAEYRAYIIGTDGRFMRAIELVCPDGEKAIEYARQRMGGHGVELWRGDRRIDRFNHTHE